MAAPFWDMSTKLEKGDGAKAPSAPGSNVAPQEHRVGAYTVVYDLPLPTDEELAEDGGMAAYLADCVRDE